MLDGPGKRFRFAISQETGKTEIVGYLDDHQYFKYHQDKDKFLSAPALSARPHRNTSSCGIIELGISHRIWNRYANGTGMA